MAATIYAFESSPTDLDRLFRVALTNYQDVRSGNENSENIKAAEDQLVRALSNFLQTQATKTATLEKLFGMACIYLGRPVQIQGICIDIKRHEDRAKGVGILEHIVRLDPSKSDVCDILAGVYFDDREYAKVAQLYEQEGVPMPSPAAHYYYGMSYAHGQGEALPKNTSRALVFLAQGAELATCDADWRAQINASILDIITQRDQGGVALQFFIETYGLGGVVQQLNEASMASNRPPALAFAHGQK